jgi:hypothetical protein
LFSVFDCLEFDFTLTSAIGTSFRAVLAPVWRAGLSLGDDLETQLLMQIPILMTCRRRLSIDRIGR